MQLGLIPGLGGTQRLPRLIGVPDALDLILTGRQVDARKARRLGLVDDTCHPADLRDRGRAGRARPRRGEEGEEAASPRAPATSSPARRSAARWSGTRPAPA